MIDSGPARRSDWRGTVALALSIVSLVLSLLALGTDGSDDDSGSSRVPPGDGPPSVASGSQVEAVAHVTLPPGTVLLSAAYRSGLETRLNAKFRLPKDELGAFVRAAKFTAPLTPGLRAVDANDNVGGGNLWDPETAKTVSGLEEQDPTPDGTRRAVLVDLGAQDAVTIYLYAGRN